MIFLLYNENNTTSTLHSHTHTTTTHTTTNNIETITMSSWYMTLLLSYDMRTFINNAPSSLFTTEQIQDSNEICNDIMHASINNINNDDALLNLLQTKSNNVITDVSIPGQEIETFFVIMSGTDENKQSTTMIENNTLK